MIKKNTKKYEKFNKDLFSYFKKIKKISMELLTNLQIFNEEIMI